MKKLFLTLTLLIFTLAACAPQPARSGDAVEVEGPSTLTVMTHDSFAISEEVIRAFEEANNVTVTFLQSGDTGSALNKAILSKSAPLADLFYGVDNTFLSRALDADIFEPYNSP
ncbi:MAG: thiamine ABC transporter substrate-binding protein, partial [Anaerolineales bacterium]